MADLRAAASTVQGLDRADGSGDEAPPLTGLWLAGLSTGLKQVLCHKASAPHGENQAAFAPMLGV